MNALTQSLGGIFHRIDTAMHKFPAYKRKLCATRNLLRTDHMNVQSFVNGKPHLIEPMRGDNPSFSAA
jgi:hypothetical protein